MVQNMMIKTTRVYYRHFTYSSVGHILQKRQEMLQNPSREGLIGFRATILARTPGLPDLQVELVLLVAPHVRVGHEVQRVAGESK